MYRVVHLHPDAPTKPRAGQPCNGCGVCCTLAPCPLGALASRRMRGPCAALEWSEDGGLYRCGLIARPGAYLPRAARRLAPLVGRAAHRGVSAGVGCDCDWEPQPDAAGSSTTSPADARAVLPT